MKRHSTIVVGLAGALFTASLASVFTSPQVPVPSPSNTTQSPEVRLKADTTTNDAQTHLATITQ